LTRLVSHTRLILMLLMFLSLTGMAQADPIFHGILPTDTFLLTDSVDTPTGPVWIYLGGYGITPGMTIYLQTVGDLCFGAGDPCLQQELPLTLVFTADNSQGARSELNQLTAIGPPTGIPSRVTGNTWFGNLPTDIAQDFDVPIGSWLSVEVPAGAGFLAVGLADSYYADNSDPGGNLGILLDTEAIPEPGTFLLFASGLGAVLLGFRRKRHS